MCQASLPPSGGQRILPSLGLLLLLFCAHPEAVLADVLCGTATPGNATKFPFLLTEDRNVIFGSNVKALRHRLQQAMALGCLPSSAASEDIHIMFQTKTLPRRSRYIQVQMEQEASGFFVPQYLMKLRGALQVWDMAESTARQLVARVPSLAGNVFVIPTHLYTDTEAPALGCPAPTRPSGTLYRYHGECYARWEYRDGAATFAGGPDLRIVPHGCRVVGCEESAAPSPEEPADVLIYGNLQCSYARRREQLCDALHAAGLRVICLHAVFGELLRHHVCRAKVVVVEHFYARAALETHRIDALLAAGRIVISVPPEDSRTPKWYHDYVTFVERSALSAVVRAKLSNWTSAMAAAEQNRIAQAFRKLTSSLTPLCHALCALANHSSPRKNLRALLQQQKEALKKKKKKP